MSELQHNILIIDDDVADRMLYKEYLKGYSSLSYNFLEAEDTKTASEFYKHYQPVVIILDFLLQGTDGLTFLMNISQSGKRNVPVILLTGYASPELFEDSTVMGAAACFNKNAMDPKAFCAAVEGLINN